VLKASFAIMMNIRRFNLIVYLLTVSVLSLFSLESLAQKISTADRRDLRKKEDTLSELSRQMVFSQNPAERFRADSNFVRTLVRALKIKNAFYHPFDSLNISRLYSPDSTFRIFTWQMKKDEYVYLQKGAIQMNMADGSLKLFPLFDNSMFSAKPLDSVRNRNSWIGAIYYKVIVKEHAGKKYYTLLGFDDFAISSNKKWMEVLSFNSNGEPVFGGPVISFKEDSVPKPTQHRFNIEYKKEAKTVFNYDADLDMIVYDHLISETDEPGKADTYIPDGDYEGFKWKDGQWVHVDKIFNFKLEDGQSPLEDKIRDAEGNIDEKKLEEASQRNIDRANQPAGSSKPPANKQNSDKSPTKKTAPAKAPSKKTDNNNLPVKKADTGTKKTDNQR
jgi:hypothetical protein